MPQHINNTSALRLNLVLILLIAVNIVNTIYPKGMGYSTEEYVGFGYELSKYINAATILVMLPSLFKRIKVFTNMRYMVILIVACMLIASGWGLSYNFSAIARSLLVCLSFIFFEETLPTSRLKKLLLYGYIITFIINVAYLVITQDRLGTAIENEGVAHGGQSLSGGIIFLIPLIFLIFRNKISSYLFIFCGIVIFISLRRTSILAYLLCIPFIYKRISGQISRKAVIIFILLLAIIIYYIVNNYWFVIENRFSDMFEANDYGYYGSGRTGWWEVLATKFLENPQNWLFGFGLGSVVKTMTEAGFPFGSAHNDYLEVIFTHGLVGGYLWFVTLWKSHKIAKSVPLKSEKTLIYMYIVTYTFYAMVSGAYHSIQYVSIAIFLNLILANQTIIFSNQNHVQQKAPLK